MEQMTGRNLGTIGRTTLYSTSLYEAARAAGIDLSPGLMFGAMPLPNFEGTPFYPYPMVPPIIQVAGNIGMAAMTGNVENLGSAMSTLIPGGVVGRRLYRTLSPKYAGYDRPNADGTIPMYNDQQAYVGSYRPAQLFMRAIGLPSMDDRIERQLVGYLRVQRDQIRNYRQQYLQAIMLNDGETANKIQADFQKRYPELGPLTVKKSDVEAVRERQTIARIPRILKGFPRDYQAHFQDLVNHALAQHMVTQAQLNPEYLQRLAEAASPNAQARLTQVQPQSILPQGVQQVVTHPLSDDALMVAASVLR
jgi:hypothetical protein